MKIITDKREKEIQKCSVLLCEKQAKWRGMCVAHYSKKRKYGTPYRHVYNSNTYTAPVKNILKELGIKELENISDDVYRYLRNNKMLRNIGIRNMLILREFKRMKIETDLYVDEICEKLGDKYDMTMDNVSDIVRRKETNFSERELPEWYKRFKKVS